MDTLPPLPQPLRHRSLRHAVIVPLLGLASSLGASSARHEERVVDLPPLVVEEAAAPLHWRHAHLPGKEVLSACSESATRDFVVRLQRQTELLNWLLPTRYQAASVIPDTYLLLSTATPRASSSEIAKELLRHAPDGASVGRTLPGLDAGRIRFLPNLRMLDVDATIVFVLLDDEDGTGGFSFTIDRVRQLLTLRRPRLPPWCVHGLIQLYPELSFENEELRAMPARWPSATEPSTAITEGAPPQPLVPMATLLNWQAADPASTPAIAPALRDAQSALFIRWALIDGDAARRAAFWRCVDRLEVEPARDALLRAELGLDFAALDRVLQDYLPRARNQRRRLHEATPRRTPEPALRDATPGEIARIRGDWERLSIGYVRQRLPELAPKYVERARRTARAGYDQGARDPSLLAVLGLIEIDAGHPAEARAWLEQAAALGAQRPRALLELALLRFADAESARGTPATPFTSEQVNAILGPLRAADALAPALPPVHTLQAEVWMRTGTPPSTAEMERLRWAATVFPESSYLVIRTAQLLAQRGETTAARELLQRGRAAGAQPSALRWFDALESSLHSATHPTRSAESAKQPTAQTRGQVHSLP